MDSLFAQVLLPLALAFIMFTLGVGLTLADFKRIATQPKAFLVGTALQFVSLPLIAIALVAFLPIPPIVKVGVVLLAACPGGTTSNLLTHMARGDVALSVSLTAITSLASVVSVPIVLMVALALFMGPDAPEVGMVSTGVVIFALTVIPVGLGMVMRQLAPKASAALESNSRFLSALVFAAVVVATVINEGLAETLRRLTQAGAVSLALNVAAMAVAFGVSSWMAFKMRQRIALTLECGLQNATLAIVVAGSLLGNIDYAMPAAIYGLLMFVTSGVFILWARRWSKAAQRARRIGA